MLWFLSCVLVLSEVMADLDQSLQVFTSVSLEAYLSPEGVCCSLDMTLLK